MEKPKTTLEDLKFKIKVDIVTMGQYLRPTKRHMKVVGYIPSQVFEYWEREARTMGFSMWLVALLLDQSYRGGELYIKHILEKRK